MTMPYHKLAAEMMAWARDLGSALQITRTGGTQGLCGNMVHFLRYGMGCSEEGSSFIDFKYHVKGYVLSLLVGDNEGKDPAKLIKNMIKACASSELNLFLEHVGATTEPVAQFMAALPAIDAAAGTEDGIGGGMHPPLRQPGAHPATHAAAATDDGIGGGMHPPLRQPGALPATHAAAATAATGNGIAGIGMWPPIRELVPLPATLAAAAAAAAQCRRTGSWGGTHPSSRRQWHPAVVEGLLQPT